MSFVMERLWQWEALRSRPMVLSSQKAAGEKGSNNCEHKYLALLVHKFCRQLAGGSIFLFFFLLFCFFSHGRKFVER